MESFRNDLKQVLRRLGRAPMFTVITLITLAAGVGANTVVFSVLEGVLLKPLPYPKPDELIGVWLTAPGINLKEFELSPSDYFIFRDQNRTLQDLGLYAGDSVSVTGVAEPEQVRALRVTDGTLPLLGMPPLLGRSFTKQDDSPRRRWCREPPRALDGLDRLGPADCPRQRRQLASRPRRRPPTGARRSRRFGRQPRTHRRRSPARERHSRIARQHRRLGPRLRRVARSCGHRSRGTSSRSRDRH